MEVLFKKGNSLMSHPVKLIFIAPPEDYHFALQAMFVVPKRNFKKAHDRNKLKRRMKEVYRVNKNELFQSLELSGNKLLLAFLYTGKKKEEYAIIEIAIKTLIKNVIKRKTPKSRPQE